MIEQILKDVAAADLDMSVELLRCFNPVGVHESGLIGEKPSGDVIEFEVSGDRTQAVHMLLGYTHNIIDLSETENLVTVMWANEVFELVNPDTFFEVV